MIAYCGLTCTECPTYLATVSDDDAARDKVTVDWSKMFGFKLSREDINCNGCKSDSGRLFGHCNTCQIRKCASEKELDTCASCDDYACEKLSAFLKFVPHAKNKLDQLRSRP